MSGKPTKNVGKNNKRNRGKKSSNTQSQSKSNGGNKPKQASRQRKGTPGSALLTRKTRLTFDGRNFLYKYINPCHNDGSHCAGVPLAVPEETAIVNSRVDQVVAAPPTLVELWQNNATGNDWFLGLFIPPWIDDCVFLIASAIQPSNFDDLSILISGALEYPAWQSTTAQPNLTNGIWYSKISSPMINNFDIVSSNVHQDFSNYRTIGRGITTQLVADALTNRGFITASQWYVPQSPINVIATTDVNGIRVVTSSEAGSALLFGEVTPKFITSADSQAYQGVAKLGCYMPLYINDDDRPMQPAAYRPLHALANKNNLGTVDISRFTVSTDFTLSIVTENSVSHVRLLDALGTVLNEFDTSVSLSAFTDTGFYFNETGIPTNAHFTIMLYESETGDDPGGERQAVSFNFGEHLWLRNTNNADGTALAFGPAGTVPTVDQGYSDNNIVNPLVSTHIIDNSQTIARKIYANGQNTGTIWYQAIAGSASVRIKGRMFLEAEAQPGSSWAGFNQPGATEDEHAMQIAAQVSKKMKHGFKASANDNGLLSKLLGGLISKIPIVGDALATLL